jgi:putative spermidine/putrescine transport system substrate-binding protein
MKANKFLVSMVMLVLVVSACTAAPTQAPATAAPATAAPATAAPATAAPATAAPATAAPATAAPATAAPTQAYPTAPVQLSLFVFAAPGHKDVPEAVVKDYMTAHPNVKIDVIEGSNSTEFPQMLAAYQTTPDNPLIDIGYFNQTSESNGALAGMWDTIDAANVPNIKYILPQFRQPEDRGVSFATGFYGILYNTKYITTPPTSYSVLWDEQYKGKVAEWDYQWEELVMAAKMNGGSESNIDPGFKLLGQHLDMFQSLYTSNDQAKNLLISGDAWLTIFDVQIAQTWVKADPTIPIGVAIPKEGLISWPLYINIVKGLTPDQKFVADDLVNQLLSPDTISKYSIATNYVPTATGITLPANLMALPQFAPDVAKNALLFDWNTINKNNADWTQRWDQEIKANLK